MKAEIVKKFGSTAQDTGKVEVQVAIITGRIEHLNGHFKKFPKDFHSKQGLLVLVGKRRRLLTYLRDKDHTRYTDLLKKLDLRK